MKNIKKMVLVSAFAGTCLTPHAQTASPVIPTDPAIETHIREWLQKMTLEQKIGQMCEITIDVVSDLETSRKKGFCLSEAMLDTVIGKYKVGSLLNVPLGVAQKKEKWAEAIKQIQEKSMKEIGIPCIYGVDQIHGTTYTQDGTMFPQGINMGATFNRELTRKGAEISAYETKAGCIPWTFAPVVDLGRDPRWARMWENYGEDCYVNAEMGISAVKGFQGENPNRIGEYHVAACMKHYMGYGVPVSGKDRTPSSISRSDMREKHFAPFLAAVRQGALSVMVNSGVDNGLPFHANRELLTEWLKEDLNWDGLIVTDWADINNLCTRDHIAATKKEAIKIAINAGIDMSMVPYEVSFCDYLKELVVEGEDDKIALNKILSSLSPTIKDALIKNKLVIQPLAGATNLNYELSRLRSYVCRYFVFLDADEAGYDAAEKAIEKGLLSESDVKYSICNGNNISEFEDCLKKDFYIEAIRNKFSVDLGVTSFRNSKKWSDRVKAVFLSQGQRWTDTVEKKVKMEVAKLIPVEDADSVLDEHKRGSIDALVNALENMLSQR